MEKLQSLALSELSIPTWQILLYLGSASFFVCSRRARYFLIATCLVTLYWTFYLFRTGGVSFASGDFLGLAAYGLFSLTVFGLTLHAFFFFKERDHFPGFTSYEIGRLRRTLLKRIDQMETAVLQAEERVVRGIQQIEEVRQKVETRWGPLESQVHQIDEIMSQRETAVQELEQGLVGQIRDLERQLEAKEELLQSRERETRDLRAAMSEQSAKFKAQLQEQEERIRGETSRKESEENGPAAIHELERQLAQKEALLLARNREIRELCSEVRDQAGALDSRSEAWRAEQAVQETSFKAKAEEWTARVRGLEEQVREREDRLKERDQEILNLRSDLDAKVIWLQNQILEREQDTGKRESSLAAAAEGLHRRIRELEDQLREKENRLQAQGQEYEAGAAASPSPEAEVKIDSLQALLKEQEESFTRRAASYKEVVETLTARIEELEQGLCMPRSAV